MLRLSLLCQRPESFLQSTYCQSDAGSMTEFPFYEKTRYGMDRVFDRMRGGSSCYGRKG